MAVYAAHLTRTVSGQPSVFSVAAQEALGSTVKPALRKVVEYLAATYPSKCSWTLQWYDELYLVLDTCLQYHYLKHYAASFSESFYGLVRVPLHTSEEFNSGVRLSEWTERVSLAMLVLMPYIRDKVEGITQRWREDDDDGKLGKNTSGSVRRAAVRVYSLIHVCCESWRLLQLALYLSDRHRSPTPSLRLLALTLRDAPPVDTEPLTWTDFFKTLLSGDFSVSLFPVLGGSMLRALQYGAFAVHFLRWWERAAHTAHALPTPTPPTHRSECQMRWRNRCPICLLVWRVPTALPQSGLVYCYKCISTHLRATNRCPITSYPASEHDLRRLYVDG